MELKGDFGRVEITVLKRNNTETAEFWDGNWLYSKIGVDVPGFKALYDANLRVDDLQRFYVSLLSLQRGESKTAEFTTMEEGLYIYCKAEPNGGFNCKGTAINDTGNKLDFKLQTELSHLTFFVNELKTTLDAYPIVGSSE